MTDDELKAADADMDQDEDGELDVEHFALPPALLKAAGAESDEEFDEVEADPIDDA